MTRLLGKPISPSAEAILRSIMESASIESCEVTSAGRTVEDQARIMYDNCRNHGVQEQLRLYKEPGQKVIWAYSDNRTKPRAEVEALMVKVIHEVGPGSVSHHISDASHDVFDVAPSSIPESKHAAFVDAVYAAQSEGKVTKFLQPPADPAYHLETPK